VDFATGDWIPREEQYGPELSKKKVLIGVLFRRDHPKYLS
jgi:hypothetical protein